MGIIRPEITTENIAMPEPEEQAELSAEESEAATEEQAETEAAQETADAEREEEHEEGEKGKPKLPRGVVKKIGKLTRQKYELLEANNELRSRLDAIEKKLDGKKTEEPTKAEPAAKPKQTDFADYDEFVEALADWKADQKITARLEAERDRESKETEQQREKEVFTQYNERVGAAREKYDDFDEALNASLRVTPAQAKTFQSVVLGIYELENGPDVAYWLAKHPEEREEILSMSGMRAVAQLGRISAKLADSEPSEEDTEEPEVEDNEAPEDQRAPKAKPAALAKPIKPVKKASPSASGLEDDLPYDEWLARRKKQLAKS